MKDFLKRIILIKKQRIRFMRVKLLLFLFFLGQMVFAQKNQELINDGVSATYEEFVVLPLGSFINNGDMYIYDDLRNDGKISFVPDKSTFFFNGPSSQKISGTGESVLSKVVFNNSSSKAPFTLEKNITIKGSVNFTDGVISYGSNGLMIFDQASSADKASQESFVVDKVRKIGNSAFVFPIGDNRTTNYVYRKLKMEAPGVSTSVVDAQFFWENPGTLYNTNSKEDKIEIIDNQEYWLVDDSSSATSNSLPDLTFYWDSTTTPGTILTSDFIDRITVARWNGTQWVAEEIVGIDENTSSIKIKPSGEGPFTFALLKTAVPDYFPTLFTRRTIVVGNSGVIDFVVFVGEANGEDSNGVNPVEIRISDSARFQFSFDVGLTNLNGQTVNNSDWSYKLERGLHKFTYIGNGGIFPGNSLSKIGVNAVFISPSNSKGQVPLKVTVKADSGGQEFTGNDNDQDVIEYNNASGSSGNIFRVKN